MTELETYIVENPLNKSNLDKLIGSFKKESFVPFIGAGPSIVLGSPDWKDLTTNLCTTFSLKHFTKVTYADGRVDYPKTFSSLFKKLNATGVTAEQFYEKLFDCLKPTKTEATWFHLKLVKLFDAYITTNYDSPIEKAFEEHYRKTPTKYYFSCYGINNFKNCIVYLHGHKEINFCIIKTEDYDYFYPTVSKKAGIPILQEFLSEIFKKKNVIFVGFSFDDVYFEKFISHLHTMEPYRNCHYWLLSETAEAFIKIMQKAEEYRKLGSFDKATDEISNFFGGKMNIKPIVYKEGAHIFIELLFGKLMESLPAVITPGGVSGVPVR